MAGNERVHKSLKVGAPPLRKSIANLPVIIHALARELRSDGCKALVQAFLETINLVVLVVQVVAWPERY